MSDKIQTYRDLIVWQKSKELVIASYLVSKSMPADEKYALVSQIKRAATSIPANIAEGFGRSSSKDREHFYTIARGSVYELDTHIQIAKDLGFINDKEFTEILQQIEDVIKLLSAFIRAHRDRSSNL